MSGRAAEGCTSLRRLATLGKPIMGDNKPFDPAPFKRFDFVLLFGANHYMGRLWDGGSMHAWDKTGGGYGPKDSFSDVEMVWLNRPMKKSYVFHHLWKGVCQPS
ncbi:hypothetical protein [Microvirga tunisiensis]|uniref:Uncharacterized protein n=1 Tax=Microvirga tunisiensis TaxID=2108360 RepID=A0A5N7MP56_9HYPH|nr:hypothetical protein [Microvirga tunisiensis]MPR07519.1 hypothetical protein [Microvirga tunisiensis]MPR25786.1 hypothetical protein [Microvirga tunisiensis]